MEPLQTTWQQWTQWNQVGSTCEHLATVDSPVGHGSIVAIGSTWNQTVGNCDHCHHCLHLRSGGFMGYTCFHAVDMTDIWAVG